MPATELALSWREGLALRALGVFRGVEILGGGRKLTQLFGNDEERFPEIFISGKGLYAAKLNAENPLGTMQSIEHALHALDKSIADEKERLARAEKMLADYQEQLGRPFEHEARWRELIVKQAH